jgi:curved DNA-binding protein CbpA
MSSAGEVREGWLATTDVEALIRELAVLGETGTFYVKIAGNTLGLFLQDGKLTGACSTREKDSLANTLIRSGRVDPHKLEGALATARRSEMSLEGVLRMMGLVDEATLKTAHWRMAAEILDTIIHEVGGRFHFAPFDFPEQATRALDISIDAILNKLKVRAKNWRVIREQIPHMEAIYQFASPPGPAKDAVTQFLIDHIDGTKTVRELVNACPASDYDTYKALVKLLATGQLIDRSGILQRHAQSQKQLQTVRRLVEQGAVYDAYRLAEQVIQNLQDFPPALQAYEEAKSMLLGRVKEVIPATRLIPIVDPKAFSSPEFRKLKLNAREGFILSRIDGKTNVNGLAALANMERDELAVLLYRLYEVKAVRFQDPAGTFSTPDEESSGGSTHTLPSLEELQATYEKYLSQNYYEIFEILRAASQEQIRMSFARLSKRYHADLYADQELDEEVRDVLDELFQIVYTAYRTLSSPESRREYDRQIRTSTDILIEQPPAEPTPAPAAAQEQAKPTPTAAPAAASTAATEPAASSRPKGRPVRLSPRGTGSKTAASSEQKRKSKKESRKEKAARTYAQAKELAVAKRWKEAEKTCLESLKYDNRNKDAYHLLAHIQLQMGGKKLKDAELNAKRAITLDRESSLYYLTLGRIIEAQEDFTKAEQYYKLSWSWDPDNEEALDALRDLKEKTRKGLLSRLIKRR